jgi:hypothetical protein
MKGFQKDNAPELSSQDITKSCEMQDTGKKLGFGTSYIDKGPVSCHLIMQIFISVVHPSAKCDLPCYDQYMKKPV